MRNSFYTLPPSAAPLYTREILSGVKALLAAGNSVDSLCKAIQHKFDVRGVHCFSSGRAALSIGLRALQSLEPNRNEVLLPAFTSFSVPSAVVNAGLKVSIYDLHPDTLAPDLASIEDAIGTKTLCVIVCHLFGYPVDVAGVQQLCRRAGAFLFDDAAQAMGASIGGKHVGTMGDLGLFSFSRGKNMTAVDGGILLTDREDITDRLKALMPKVVHGSKTDRSKILIQALALTFMLHPRAYWLPASMPFLNIGVSLFDPNFFVQKLDTFRAGMAEAVLKRLSTLTQGRRKVASALLKIFDNDSPLQTVRPFAGAEPVFLRLPLLPKSGWGRRGVPQNQALGIVRSYPMSLQEIPELKPHLVRSYACPGARMLSRNLLTLPTHEYVSDKDVDAMVGYFGGVFSDHTTNYKR